MFSITSSPRLSGVVDGDLIPGLDESPTMTHALLPVPDLTKTAEVSGLLARLTEVEPPSGAYNRLIQAIFDGRLESVKVGGRHFVPRRALPRAAEILGLSVDPNLFTP